MKNNINYYIKYIEDSDTNILISRLDNDSSLEIVKELIYNYLIRNENILILSRTLNSNLLIKEIFDNFDFLILDLESNYDYKDKLTNLLNLNYIQNKNYISKIGVINRNIKKKSEILLEVNSLFSNKINGNMSLVEKYIKIDKTIKQDRYFNKEYRILRDNNRLSKYEYSELKNLCNSIVDSNTSEAYIKYRRLVDNNIFNSLITPIDYKCLEVNLSKLEEIIKNLDKYKLIHSDYSQDFFDELLNSKDIDEGHILSLSKLINFKYNYILLNKKKNSKWFNLWGKRKNLDNDNNLNLYHDTGKKIYNEYMYNLQKFKEFQNDLLFLKNILKEDKYNEIFKSFIEANSLKETLLFFKNLLSIAKNTENTFEIINKLSDNEKDILSYCYDYYNNKENIDSLVKIIPHVKMYLEIEEEESKKMDLINLCSKYDDLLSDINNEVNKRNSLKLNYINNLWLKTIREKYDIFKNNIDNKNFKNYYPCIISDFSNESIKKIIDDGCYFKKIIILSDTTDNFTEFESLNTISENIIFLSNGDIDLVNFNKIDSTSINKLNTDNYYKNIYKEIEDYLVNKCNIEKIIINTNYMAIYSKNIKLFIKVSPVIFYNSTDDVNEDIYLNRLCKSNNTKFYRVWYRNWWLDKFKELKTIVRLLS